jgi:peptide chain release factor 3
MDQVANSLEIRTAPLNWPVRDADHAFVGVYDCRSRSVILFAREGAGAQPVPESVHELDDPVLRERLGPARLEALRDDVALIEAAADPWDADAYLRGEVTPFLFGSAMTNAGVALLLAALGDLAPPPTATPATEGARAPEDPDFSAFVFKIQANMNPRHRDRIAFLRVVSGRFSRGMEVTLARTGRTMRLNKPHTFLADERSIVEEAEPGDIVGLYDPGELRLGDTLFQGLPVAFRGIPRFAPEFFARLKLRDATRRKQLTEGLQQLSQEGAIQLFIREGLGAADPYLGAVGQLQFEVLRYRLEHEYGTRAELEPVSFGAARWIGGDGRGLAWLAAREDFVVVADRHGAPVVLAPSPWSLQYALSQCPGLELHEVSQA